MVSDVYKMTNRKMISSSFLSACRFRRLAFDVVNLDRPILLQNVGDLSGIPDRYHLKMTEVDVFPGNPLYVVRRYGRYLLRIRIPIVHRQPVELLSDYVVQQCLRRLQLNGEASDDGSFRSIEFILRDSLIANSLQLIHQFIHRALGDFGPHFGVRPKCAAILERREAAVRAIGIAFVLAKVEEEPRA